MRPNRQADSATGSAEIGSGRIIDDNKPPVRQSLDGMAHISGHDRNESRLCDLGHTIDGQLQLTLHHLVDFLFFMKVLMNGGTAREIVMCNVMLAVWK